jgi:hypothetical protein
VDISNARRLDVRRRYSLSIGDERSFSITAASTAAVFRGQPVELSWIEGLP